MAVPLQFSSSLLFVIAAAAIALQLSPALSLTCTTQTFSQKTNFANCTDLPTLKAFLHWTYDSAAKPNPTLSVAFIAPPASPEGWVAWALNPTGSGMLGAQSLIAFRDTNGSVVVKTYNISSYSAIAESKISYNVLNKRAEHSDGVTRIFATLELPAPAPAAEVNQVWQVGALVKNGVPVKHDFSPDNLSSKNTLRLASTADTDKAPAPAPESVAPSGRQSGRDNGGSTRVWGSRLGSYGVLALLGALVYGF